MKLLPCVEIGPADEARAAVVWLHGLGADGHDFEPLVPELGLPQDVRFVFPHAPVQPVTVNGGMPMPAWFDIAGADLTREADEAGLRRSVQRVRALLEREEERGVPAERIVLAGFSQGGAVALHLGLEFPRRLAGILALSTYLPTLERPDAVESTPGRDVPILQIHGQMDPIVPIELGERTRDRLRGLGYPLQWQEYPMMHEVCLEEVLLIAAWLGERLR